MLLLAAWEGLVGYAWDLGSRVRPARYETILVVLEAVGLTLAPLGALVMLVVHCRLLYWSGKALGGRARPDELHAVAAWSAVPIALTAWPAVLRVGLRLARLDREVVPGWLQLASDLADGLARASRPVAMAATFLTVALYVIFLAEAQQFTKKRAVLNQLLAAFLFFALLAGGIALGWAVADHRTVAVPALTCAVIALLAWRIRAGRAPIPRSGLP